MRYGGVLLAVCCLLGGPGRAAAEELRVGPLGDPSRLDVRGVKRTLPEAVVRALFGDVDVAYASFPDDPLAEFKRLLIEKTMIGLRHSGFPQPHVSIADRLDHLELNVEEGPRWLAGEIQVVGARGIDVRKVVAELLPADAAEAVKNTIWAVGRPAHLDEPTRQRLSKRINELLAERGYPAAQFDVAVLGDRGRAALRISIQDEGTPFTLREIDVEGNSIHSREQILTYLQLPADTLLTVEARKDVEKRLEASGRFSRVSVYTKKGEALPRLWVEEFLQAPRLDEPLTPEESALLKLSHWVGGFQQQTKDLELRSGAGKDAVEWTMSPQRSLIVRPAAPHGPQAPNGFGLALTVTKDQVAIYSTKSARKLVLNLTGSRFIPQAKATLIVGAPDWTGEYSINLFLGTGRSARKPDADIVPALWAAPALSIVRKLHAACQWDGPVLTAEWKDHKLQVDSRDGRLIELREAKRKMRSLFAKGDDQYALLVTTADGLFQRRLDEIAQGAAGFTDITNFRRLVSGTAEFVCQALAEQDLPLDDDARHLLSAIEVLSRRGIFQGLDQHVLASMQPKADEFLVPVNTSSQENSFWLGFNRKDHMQITIRPTDPGFADRLFARGSHAWHVWREAAFILARKNAYTSQRLERLLPAAEHGPLADLMLAETAEFAGLNDLAAVLARQGLENADLGAFRRDCADFLAQDAPIWAHILRTAEAFRGLQQVEAEALCRYLANLKWLSKSNSRYALQFLNDLCADSARSTPAALRAALDNLWQAGLQRKVLARFNEIIAAPSPKNAPSSPADSPSPEARRRRFLFR